MNKNYQAVLFDMDGLMLDTERIYYRSQQEAARLLGYEASDALMLSFVGLSVATCEQRMREAAGQDFPIDAFKALWPRLWQEYVVAHGISLKEGLTPILEWLKAHDVPRAVVTSSFAAEAELSLRAAGVDGYFECVVTGDQVKHAKPAPDIYLSAAKQLGVEPGVCIALEDSEAGVLSADAAGMRVILVPDMRQPSLQAREAAECVLPSLLDALPLVQDWLRVAGHAYESDRADKVAMNGDPVRRYNSQAWDIAVARGSEWTVPVSAEQVAAARQGDWQIRLTPSRSVPGSWFPTDLHGQNVLCLASGGGQQGPILAAAGATVTVLDNSPAQLAKDSEVARRENLSIRTIEGDMADLSMLADASFDLVINPTSNLFAPDILLVWREAFRVLRKGGGLMAGFMNPVTYIFDQAKADEGILEVRHKLPYSDLTSISEEERKAYEEDWQPYEFGHTLEDQIGGQLAAGFVITDFYEDVWPGTALAEYISTFAATCAKKPDW